MAAKPEPVYDPHAIITNNMRDGFAEILNKRNFDVIAPMIVSKLDLTLAPQAVYYGIKPQHIMDAIIYYRYDLITVYKAFQSLGFDLCAKEMKEKFHFDVPWEQEPFASFDQDKLVTVLNKSDYDSSVCPKITSYFWGTSQNLTKEQLATRIIDSGISRGQLEEAFNTHKMNNCINDLKKLWIGKQDVKHDVKQDVKQDVKKSVDIMELLKNMDKSDNDDDIDKWVKSEYKQNDDRDEIITSVVKVHNSNDIHNDIDSWIKFAYDKDHTLVDKSSEPKPNDIDNQSSSSDEEYDESESSGESEEYDLSEDSEDPEHPEELNDIDNKEKSITHDHNNDIIPFKSTLLDIVTKYQGDNRMSLQEKMLASLSDITVELQRHIQKNIDQKISSVIEKMKPPADIYDRSKDKPKPPCDQVKDTIKSVDQIKDKPELAKDMSKDQVEDSSVTSSTVTSSDVTNSVILECSICLDRKPNVVIVDCGHIYCSICIEPIKQCPNCCKKINKVIPFFIP